jgi:hypothetical protein
LDWQQVVALLREMVGANFAQPSLVSIEKNSNDTFSLTMKVNGAISQIFGRFWLAETWFYVKIKKKAHAQSKHHKEIKS